MNRQCDACRPGVRCQPCRDRSRAHLRMYRLVRIEGLAERTRQPIEYAEQVTSMNDARAALCFAMGVRVDDIDPCTGHNLGRPA